MGFRIYRIKDLNTDKASVCNFRYLDSRPEHYKYEVQSINIE